MTPGGQRCPAFHSSKRHLKHISPQELRGRRMISLGRSLHSDLLREPLPDRIPELLRQLDERLRQLDQDDDKA